MSSDDLRPDKTESLSDYIRRLREQRGLSLGDVSRLTSNLPSQQRVTTDWLSRAERGEYQHPAPEKLRVLAFVYNVPVEWLLTKAGLQILPGHVAAEWPEEIRQLALYASQISPAGLQLLFGMVAYLKRYEDLD
jgi:transcriptional regulator with XRE-family HTH domain